MDFTLLDKYLPKVPIEEATKHQRAEQRFITKHISAIGKILLEAQNDPKITPERLQSIIDAASCLTKDSVSAIHAPTDQCVGHIDSAVEHLGSRVKNDVEISEWNKTRVHRYIIDFLLREGWVNSAKELAKDLDLTDLNNIGVFMEIERISNSLRGHEVHEALQWSFHNRAKLRKLGSTLEFELRLQEYLEHVKAGRERHAIAYAKKYLAQFGAAHIADIRTAMTLLAFGPDTDCERYKYLLRPERWDSLQFQFNMDAFALHGMERTSPLIHALKAGLSVLKTRICSGTGSSSIADSEKASEAAVVNCPVCDPTIAKVAAALPFAHHTRSILLCRITGKLMNDDNPPMVLPNGNVYSLEAVDKLASSSGGYVKDPRTGDRYRRDELKKAFIS